MEPPRAHAHASLYWTACYDDYCSTYRQMKDNNYYPSRANNRHRRSHRSCECTSAHPSELTEVIRTRHLDPRKACAAWQKGKRVCPECRFLVNMTDHHRRCGTASQRAPQVETAPKEEHEAPAEPIATTTPNQGEQNAAEIEALKRLIALVYRETTLAATQNRNQQRNEARVNNERHEADQVQLQRMIRNLATITQE